MCPLVLQKLELCVPLLHRWWGNWGQQIQEVARRAMKQMLVQGNSLRVLDEVREVGHHQYPGPENHDSQHMLDQPRGSFPERSVRAKLVLQNLCCASHVCTGGRGDGGSISKHSLEEAMKQMLVREHSLRLLDEAGSLTTSSTLDRPENQDSQHKLNQPRGSFPEKGRVVVWHS